MNDTVKEFFLNPIIGGAIYDFVKYGVKVSIKFLKDKLPNVRLSEDELEKLKNLINKSAEDEKNLESSERFTETIENDDFYKELASKYKEKMINIEQNIKGDGNSTTGTGDIIHNYYGVESLQKKE